MSSLTRETKETRVRVSLGPGDAGGNAVASREVNEPIAAGDGFLTHMLTALVRYSGLPLAVEATGDLRHHLIEDVAIALGTLLGRETPAACARYGEATIPMDDALVQVALDVGGRPHYEGGLPSDLYEHFFRSLALNADWTVHVRVLRGRDRHHIVEAAFKALGLALRQALAAGNAVFSTKGAVAMTWDRELDEAAELGPVTAAEPGPATDASPGPTDRGAS